MIPPAFKVLDGDVRERLAELPEDTFHTVVTSPPYWGLRDYGVEGQIGLEETFEEFLDVLVEVFAQVKRVLRPDGTIWLNMGDSYASDGGPPTQGKTGVMRSRGASKARERAGRRCLQARKPKDLVGQPWALAFALRDRLGLWLRAEIIWHKRSVMPDSAGDRPTRAHEQVFLFAKRERYFYDGDAVREPLADDSAARYDRSSFGGAKNEALAAGDGTTGPHRTRMIGRREIPNGRNMRTVWTLGPEPSESEHFAAFPTKLVEPCVLAGTSEHGCCASCGAPWRRVKAAATGGAIGKSWHDHEADEKTGNFKTESSAGYEPGRTIGWEPSCRCRVLDDVPEPIPCRVLDPFSGTATTGVVALRLGRSYCGIELNPAYAGPSRERLARARDQGATPLFDRRPPAAEQRALFAEKGTSS